MTSRRRTRATPKQEITMTNWNCDDGHGDTLGQGMTYDSAIRRAQAHADATGLACIVYSDDDDSEVISPRAA